MQINIFKLAILALSLCFSSQIHAADRTMPGLLHVLISGEISKIPQDPYNYIAVHSILDHVGKSGCQLQEPSLSLFKPYLPEIMSRIVRKSEGVPAWIGTVSQPKTTLEVSQLILNKGCDSAEVQAVIENAARFGLGREPEDVSAAFPLHETSKKVRLYGGVTDRYCSWPPGSGGLGRDDPACEKMINFRARGMPRRLPDGSTAPAVGQPTWLMRCVYKAKGFERLYVFWYEKVPENLASYAVCGKNPFPGVENAAVTVCPADSDEAYEIASAHPRPTEADWQWSRRPDCGRPVPVDLTRSSSEVPKGSGKDDNSESCRNPQVQEDCNSCKNRRVLIHCWGKFD